ncbi:MAG TPA: hypothetical protein VLY46_03855 [Usitatibacter sp.]|nr:hypothetical protein [Usitatibacter sp.]
MDAACARNALFARPISTPFGTIYSSNITPDAQTGIGLWSEEAFRRARREGIDRGGHELYPAFPYDRFTLASDADDRAIYAYLMTRPAVSSRPAPDRLAFPFNVRSFIAAWKAPESRASGAWSPRWMPARW